jgi:DNA-binding CsgD family transcriptional regulator/sugar-specific transcriptional regulator TrmB
VLASAYTKHQAREFYRLVMTHPSWRAERIAVELGLSTEELHAVLDRLTELNLIRRSLEVPQTYLPVVPEVGFQKLLRQQRAEISKQYARFLDDQADAATLMGEYREVRSKDAGHLKGMDSARHMIEQIAQRTSSEFVAFISADSLETSSAEASESLDQMCARGVVVRCIYLDSVRKDPPVLEHSQRLTDIGVQLRTAQALPTMMFISDRISASVSTDPGDSSQGFLQISDRGVVTALVELFELIWSSALPFYGENDTRAIPALTDRERALLLLLAQGTTDEIAARRLGVSLRTVRRTVSTIMSRLGVRSRFEVGLRAVELNWLSPSRDLSKSVLPLCTWRSYLAGTIGPWRLNASRPVPPSLDRPPRRLLILLSGQAIRIVRLR